MLKVSVIIVNYNSRSWLQKCIDALRQSDYPFIEIIIIDNNSSDGSTNFIHQYEQIIFHQSIINLGYSAGNNKGVEMSSGDLLLVLNPDAIVVKDSIRQLVNTYQTLNNKNIILAPQLFNFDESVQISYWKFMNVGSIIKETFFLNLIFPDAFKLCPNNLCECEALSGAAFMISKERWKELNGLDENLFWVEDVDICYRNKKAGGKNYLLKLAKVYHYIGGSSEKNIHKVIANQIFSRLKFFNKHYDKKSSALVISLLIIQCISRIFIYSLILWWNKKARKKISGYFIAIKQIIFWIVKDEYSIIK